MRSIAAHRIDVVSSKSTGSLSITTRISHVSPARMGTQSLRLAEELGERVPRGVDDIERGVARSASCSQRHVQGPRRWGNYREPLTRALQ